MSVWAQLHQKTDRLDWIRWDISLEWPTFFPALISAGLFTPSIYQASSLLIGISIWKEHFSPASLNANAHTVFALEWLPRQVVIFWTAVVQRVVSAWRHNGASAEWTILPATRHLLSLSGKRNAYSTLETIAMSLITHRFERRTNTSCYWQIEALLLSIV